MRNASYGKSAHTLTVSMQVYVGDAQVYAKDTTSGTYAKEKRYTYYAALFADKARTPKVSDVKEITVSGLSGSASDVDKRQDKGRACGRGFKWKN